MNSDVRDILEINQQPQQPTLSKVTNSNNNKKNNRIKRLIEPIRRPEGVHREVWGLMSKFDSDQPPLIPSNEPRLYKHPKAQLRYGVRKWHWIEFKNPARTDEATFSHWRCVNDDPNKEYPFAKFNKVRERDNELIFLLLWIHRNNPDLFIIYLNLLLVASQHSKVHGCRVRSVFESRRQLVERGDRSFV